MTATSLRVLLSLKKVIGQESNPVAATINKKTVSVADVATITLPGPVLHMDLQADGVTLEIFFEDPDSENNKYTWVLLAVQKGSEIPDGASFFRAVSRSGVTLFVYILETYYMSEVSRERKKEINKITIQDIEQTEQITIREPGSATAPATKEV